LDSFGKIICDYSVQRDNEGVNLAGELIVVGGGLAGSEAAWQAAQRGCRVKLFEMRPAMPTGAHVSPYLAELVCSNSLGSNLPDRASGLLKAELRILGSLLLEVADEVAVPAGGALAVDRDLFSRMVTQRLEEHPHIEIIREEMQEIPSSPAILASGPLTSLSLSRSLQSLTKAEHLYFYDAIAPIVTQDSINFQVAYRGSRYSRGNQVEGDYINCPLNRDEYYSLVDELLTAERIELKDFERELENGVKAGANRFFEGCLPVEILARRGRDALAFGPMRPIGLVDPRTGKRPFAVLQLRQDNIGATLFNMVGFQTNLKFSEQRRVFRMIPGLEQADFERYGQMHRNTFIYSPALLRPSLQAIWRDDLYFAGQITGVEGYTGNIGTGLLAGWNAARTLYGKDAIALPQTTMLGALCHYITHASAANFQPMKANFGVLPALETIEKWGQGGKRERARAYMQRSLEDLETFLENIRGLRKNLLS
jgi:methylenetetrahydrofolate--tRNA-(uracil-5-)-methyltransferase